MPALTQPAPLHPPAAASLDRAFAVVEEAVRQGAVPGAAAAVGTAGGTLRREHYGYAALSPRRRTLPADALFDLASLTKIVATTTLALRLMERGTLHLDRRVASVLPEFGAAGKSEITVRHLLAHTSGMGSPVGGWREQFSRREAHPPIWELICRAPLLHPTGSAVHYSDTGFFTLGVLLAKVGGAPLDQLARREVFEPLGMVNTQFRPPPKAKARAAATEVVPARGGAVTGIVHDEMAAAAGGVAGHAGLFSTCRDVERFCRLWLGRGTLEGQRFLSDATIAAATGDQTGGLRDPAGATARRGLGWVLQPNARWVGADLASDEAYSHTGFTGTSLLIDPLPYDPASGGLFAVLLTNRVHPTRHDGSLNRISALRTRFHNVAVASLSSR